VLTPVLVDAIDNALDVVLTHAALVVTARQEARELGDEVVDSSESIAPLNHVLTITSHSSIRSHDGFTYLRPAPRGLDKSHRPMRPEEGASTRRGDAAGGGSGALAGYGVNFYEVGRLSAKHV
jgi:hypothetical protein